jgi:drug/metabolite transporter (DMT)-like permease
VSHPAEGWRVLVVWWVTCLLWSSVWLCIKIGVGDVPPATFASARLVIALLVLLPIFALRRVPLPRERRDWLLIGATGFLLLGLNYALLYWGAQYITSGLSAVLQAATPAFGLMFAHVLSDDERFTGWQIAGLLLGVLGVGVIFADQLTMTRAAFWAASRSRPLPCAWRSATSWSGSTARTCGRSSSRPAR